MNLTALVDVAIGVILVYLGASHFVTVNNEYIAHAVNLRGRHLCESLKTLIGEGKVRDILIQSPVLKPFFDKDAGQVPSYLDTNVFAHLLVGGLAIGSGASDTVKQVSEALEKLPDSNLKTQLQALVRTAGTTTDTLVNLRRANPSLLRSVSIFIKQPKSTKGLHRCVRARFPKSP